MRDYDYDGGREDMRSDARAEGGGGRRYRYSCGDATCGASDCGDCRNGDEDEVEAEDEEEAEGEEAEVRGDDDDDDADWRMCEGCGAYTPTARSRSWSDHAWCDQCTSKE